jgi:predicted ABC-type ATPase
LADSPHLLVVGGPNGSGKTTLALEYAAETGFRYIGADAIAAEIDLAHPSRARIAAARQFIHQVDDSIAARESLVVESTLSGLTMRNGITKAKSQGYVVSMAFLFVDSADVCVARVDQRVRKGGHLVPEADIRRRFLRAIVNFWTIYREMAENWVLLYNGDTAIQDVAGGSRDRMTIREPTTFATFLDFIESSGNG